MEGLVEKGIGDDVTSKSKLLQFLFTVQQMLIITFKKHNSMFLSRFENSNSKNTPITK